MDTAAGNHQAVVDYMMANDLFSQWMGIQIVALSEGYSKLQLMLRQEMMNGFGMIHGGILFSLADSAFAIACNSRNNLSMALDVSISFTKPAYPGEVLTAEALEMHNGNSTGLYLIHIHNQKKEQVALFKGTCFRTGKTIT